MALIKTTNGFAIEYDCKLMEDKPARIMDISEGYNLFCKTVLEAIACAAQDTEHRGDLIYELTRILEAALPSENQSEILFNNMDGIHLQSLKQAS